MKSAISNGAFALAIVFAIGGASAASARNYDCTKAGNANKAQCKAAAASTPAAAPAPAKPTMATPVAAPTAGALTAQCKDGTAWSGKLKFAACSGHKGVATWGGSAAKAPQPTFMKTVPASKGAPIAMATGGGAGQVWVNTKSKVYHCQGTAYYGKTKAGQYMTESAALAAGAHADHGKACH